MDLKRYTHADARDVRSLLLDIHDEAYADTPDEFHSRERFSYFVDRWSSREDWLCISGWEQGGPVGCAYGSMFKPGGWWKGHPRPRELRGSVFALSELMVVSKWRGTKRAQKIHDALLKEVTADMVSLTVETERPRVQAMYERWNYAKVGEAMPSDDSPLYAVMVRKL
ncbi:GNAT family N-acetyltransferase [Streptomyces jumonjinensis]|uniref:GNAT family N-acetyltransferase n=1 Tax=Streptomyces jumonjinensis TaxID=1945 RepID=A0A646KBM2_STRJU|nr:GNAT family N-acetyltransferase [Streptomyces jumonjinensis]MQS99641.1 GNAT family N-acetyltransferase [Streptomyces jumonjinensis]